MDIVNGIIPKHGDRVKDITTGVVGKLVGGYKETSVSNSSGGGVECSIRTYNWSILKTDSGDLVECFFTNLRVIKNE